MEKEHFLQSGIGSGVEEWVVGYRVRVFIPEEDLRWTMDCPNLGILP